MRFRGALLTILAAAALDAVGGLVFAAVEHLTSWQGIYWAVATATTVGYGDITPHTLAGHVIAVLVMLTVVPLFAATFSLFTSGLTAGGIQSACHRTVTRLDHIIRHHPAIPDLPRSTDDATP